ncbi:DUF7677 family protein [Streptomyces canus]
MRESPSQMEISASQSSPMSSTLDEQGEPVNEKHAECRAATWLNRYCTGELPPGEPDIEPWEGQLH